MDKDNEVKESSDTDSQKAESEEYRSFVEEPGDDDGEDRHPKKRYSIIATSLLETKAMIGSGLLNVPYTFKTLGLIFSVGASILFNLVTFLSTYFLLRCKDITQRYSYAIYSKLTMGKIGTVSCKLAILIRSISLCCVLLKILGNILRTLLLIFFNEYKDKFYLDSKFLLIVFGLLITPLMIQKDISGIAKFTFLGIYSITYLFASLVILFIYKYTHDEILPYEPRMINPSGTPFEIFKCFGSYLNAYLFQVNVFPIYLPLHPRTTKNMITSTALGTMLSSVIYISFGTIGFFIYRYDINGTLLVYLGDDLIDYVSTNLPMAALLIVFEIAFIINTTISTALNFFVAKSECISIAKLILKKYQGKKMDESISGTPLVSLDESGYSTENPGQKGSEESILNERSQTLITLVAYIITMSIGYYSDNIITIDNFNGSTVNNYLSVMLPPLFFIILSRKKKFSFEKLIAILLILFSFGLITGYFLFNFTSIFA
jgi:amino acid permease